MKKTSKAAPAKADAENPVFTEKDFARARRIEDIPALAHLTKRTPGQRGPQKAPTKKSVTLRLDQDVVAHYRGKGPGWQTKINKALRAAAKLGEDA